MQHDLLVGLGQEHPVFWYCDDKKKRGIIAREVEKVDIEEAKRNGMGVYFAANEFGDQRNDAGNLRHKGNALRPLACFADFDTGTYEEQLNKIINSPLEPSAWVKSGHGYHVYWFLDGATKEDLPRWTEVQKSIAAYFGSDDAVSDFARLMRLPGSWHCKDEEPKLVTLERCDATLRYSLDELEAEFPRTETISQGSELERLLQTSTGEGGRNVNATKVIGMVLNRFPVAQWQTVAWPMVKAWNLKMCTPPVEERELRASFNSIAKREGKKRETEERGVTMFREHDMSPVVNEEGETVIISIAIEDGIAKFSFWNIEQSRQDTLNTMLSVELVIPGSHPKPFTMRINLFSHSAMESFARSLGKSLGGSLKWDHLLNTAQSALVRHLSNRDLSIDLADVADEGCPMLFAPFLVKDGANMLFGDGGCLSGDTQVEINRGGKSFKLTLRELVYKFNGGKSSPDGRIGWDLRIPTTIRSHVKGYIKLMRVLAAVTSGEKTTYTVRTESGRCLRATTEHPFLTSKGWKKLCELKPGDMLVCDGHQKKGGPSVKAQYQRVTIRNHPYAAHKADVRVPYHRIVAEAELNNLPTDVFIDRLHRNDLEGLRFLDPKIIAVHHVNRDSRDNRPENLLVLSHAQHAELHAREGNTLNVMFQATTDGVVSITEHGKEETYDLTVEGDDPNFLANGLVVHNTGKTFFCLRLAISLATGREFLGYQPQEAVPTLFIDYEDNEKTASFRLSRLCADPTLRLSSKDVKHYIRYLNPQGAPLYTIVPALKKIIREHNIGLVLVDSVASACGAEPEKAEAAAQYYNALKALNVTTLSIAHVVKTEGAKQDKAFGSVFWHNLARNTWNLQGEEDPEEDKTTLGAVMGEKSKQLGLFHRKFNGGPKSQPINVKIVYGTNNVRFEEGKPDYWNKDRKLEERIIALLKINGPRTKGELYEDLINVPDKTLKNVLAILKQKDIIKKDETRGGRYYVRD